VLKTRSTQNTIDGILWKKAIGRRQKKRAFYNLNTNVLFAAWQQTTFAQVSNDYSPGAKRLGLALGSHEGYTK
jgi:hypothetical protein